MQPFFDEQQGTALGGAAAFAPDGVSMPVLFDQLPRRLWRHAVRWLRQVFGWNLLAE
jgi:hypothetical protein